MKKHILFLLLIFILLPGCQVEQHNRAIETNPPLTSKEAESDPVKYPPAQYLVGVDIPAGEYKLICEDADFMGFYFVSSDALAKNIIASDHFYNMAYVVVENGQYLKLDRCYTDDSLRRSDLPSQEAEETPASSAPEISATPEATNVPEITPTPLPPTETPSADSIFDEETWDKLNAAIKEHEKRKLMLCIAQDDLEGYYWGKQSACPGLWEELLLDYMGDGLSVLQDVKNDLDIYLAFGSSSYEVLWISAEAIYEAYDSGQLEASMDAEQYQKFCEKMDAVSKRLGILYASPEYIIP